MPRSSVFLIVCTVLATSFMIEIWPSIAVAQEGVLGSVNPVFVTSVTGTGDLETWSDSGATAGLAGADLICRARAAAASLPNAGLYIAWLSDSVDDAYCRIHGMSGKKATNCGGFPDPPSFAGPWARTDGQPFGPDIHLLLGFHGEVLTPPLLDEFGMVSPSDWIFTATDGNGEFDGASSAACSNWSSSVQLTVGAGSTRRTTGSWTDYGTIGCGDPYPLLCMLPGDGPPLPQLYNQGALAFLTTSTGQGRLEDWSEAGGLQGLAAADNICLLRALARGLPHPQEFKAWLSTATVDAADRFTFGGPWVRPDGVIVADSKSDLISGELQAPINQTAWGEYWGNHGVWTGSTATGTGSGSYCVDWTSASGGDTGTTGAANSITQWSEVYSTSPCSSYASIYCLSNVPSAVRIFLDGFESGDYGSWSFAIP